jgi:hypothetical protein
MTSAERQRLVEAISEGLLRQYDEEMSTIEKHPRCSKQHYEKMSEIVGFKVRAPRRISKKGLTAILLAAVLLLTGCAVFKNEIRDFFVEIYETIIKVTFDNEPSNEKETIGEVYELTIMPDGYTQTTAMVNPLIIRYEYTNLEGNYLTFEQVLLDRATFLLDAENGNTTMVTVGDYEIYYRCSNSQHRYIWNDGKYAMTINTDVELNAEDLEKLISGIK